MSKQILLEQEARLPLKKGVDFLANAVKVTLGGAGKIVAIDVPYSTPILTKDGVTVARSVELEDPRENMGASLLKSVAVNTNSKVGDGTTTATVLAQELIKQGFKNLSTGTNPILIKRGMDKALKAVSEYLDNSAYKSTSKSKLLNVATISANNDDEVGQLVVDTFWKVKKDGVINIQESSNGSTYTDFSTGMKFKSELASKYFLKDKILEVSNIKNAVICLFLGNIIDKKQLLPVLNMATERKKHLVLVCNEIEPHILQSVINSYAQAKVDVSIMESPLFGEYRVQALEDISLLTGARVINQEKGEDLIEFTPNDFGELTAVNITPDSMALSNKNSNKSEISRFVKFLDSKLKEEKDELNRSDIKERIARFKGGIATIYVGGNSKVEIKELQDRIEDSKNAVFAASKGGLVPGGGVALLKSRKVLDNLKTNSQEIQIGIDIVKKSLSAPIKQILHNAGLESGEIIGELSRHGKNFGYDVIEGKITDMIKAGIVDPKEVTQAALTSAVSVAGSLLTTDCVLVDTTNFDTKEINISGK